MSGGLIESAQNMLAGVLDLAMTVGVAVFFLVAAAIVGWQVQRVAGAKPRAFDATISELENDLKAIKP